MVNMYARASIMKNAYEAVALFIKIQYRPHHQALCSIGIFHATCRAQRRQCVWPLSASMQGNGLFLTYLSGI